MMSTIVQLSCSKCSMNIRLGMHFSTNAAQNKHLEEGNVLLQPTSSSLM